MSSCSKNDFDLNIKFGFNKGNITIEGLEEHPKKINFAYLKVSVCERAGESVRERQRKRESKKIRERESEKIKKIRTERDSKKIRKRERHKRG